SSCATNRPAIATPRTRPRSWSFCSGSISKGRPWWSRRITLRWSTACAGASCVSKTAKFSTTTSEATTSVDWGKLKFFLGEVGTNFTRNAAMQFTAIGTVAVTIVLLGTFLYVRETLTTFGQGILKQIEIAVYLDDDATDAQAKALA